MWCLIVSIPDLGPFSYFLVCPGKFIVVKLSKGIEVTAFIKQMWAILKDTDSAASKPSLGLFPGSTDMRPMLL